MQVTHERVKVPVGSLTMPAYLARPTAPGTYPAVLVFMEIFGVNHHIRSVADRVAAEGYVALAPDVFHRTAPGIELKYDAAGLERGIELMSQVKASEAIADVAGGARLSEGTARGRRPRGRRHGLLLRRPPHVSRGLRASPRGGGELLRRRHRGRRAGRRVPPTIDRTPKINGRMLCLFGERDGYIPLAQVAAIKEALAAAHVDHEVVVYPGVGHGFFCDERADYDATSAEDAWHRVTGLFRRTLV